MPDRETEAMTPQEWELCAPFVAAARRKLASAGASLLGSADDVEQAAYEVVLRAHRQYDPDRGTPYGPYMTQAVRQRCWDLLRKSRHHLPQSVKDAAVAAADARREGVDPTSGEVARRTGSTDEEAEAALRLLFLDRSISRPDVLDDEQATALPEQDDGPEDVIAEQQAQTELSSAILDATVGAQKAETRTDGYQALMDLYFTTLGGWSLRDWMRLVAQHSDRRLHDFDDSMDETRRRVRETLPDPEDRPVEGG